MKMKIMKEWSGKQVLWIASVASVVMLVGCETAPPVREYSSREYYESHPGYRHTGTYRHSYSQRTVVAPGGEQGISPGGVRYDWEDLADVPPYGVVRPSNPAMW